MKVLLFVLLAGYAVKCDDNNYYVIEMPKDLPNPKPFYVYWNVPTKQCKSKKIPFTNLYEKFGIIQNDNDYFRGEKVTILYDPGLFPALLKNETSGRFKFRNGGVPQEGDLDKHLQAFEDELDQSIPDKNFDGVGIIDFESWRPVYRQNFGVLRPYKDVSLEIERELHWWWQKKWLEAEAKRRFEEAARTFMQSTIALARRRRPRAQWGFYGFPYCFNMASNNMRETCADNVPHENDKYVKRNVQKSHISWLWRESTTLYPSVYSSVELSTTQLVSLIRGRVREAARFDRPILPYFWYRYRDAGFLTQVDLNAALDTLFKSNASGIIIWGSSSDVNTVEKCTNLLNYIEQVMGPAIAKYTKPRRSQDDITTSTDHTSSTVDGSTLNTDVTTNSNRIKDLDPEYHWIPPENYTQDIKDHVAEEISKRVTNNTGPGDNAVLDNNVLIDLILNSVFILSKSEDNSTKNSHGSETTKLEEESFKSTVTQANKVLKIETTSMTNNYVSVDSKNNQEKLENVSNTEITNSFYATSNTPEVTSQNYTSINEEVTEYATTSILPDKITDITMTDKSRSKNNKKTSFQDSTEDYYDITTEITISTESESDIYKQTENTARFMDYTTEINVFDSKEAYTTEVLQTHIDNIDSTTMHSASTFNSLIENSRIDDITFTTETNDLRSQTSQIKKSKYENETSTTESFFNTTLELNTTKSQDLEDKYETAQDLKDNVVDKENISTKTPDFKEVTAIEVNLSTKETHKFEDTSLAPTSTSPEQVVVYV